VSAHPARLPAVRAVRVGRRSAVAVTLVSFVGFVAFTWPLLARQGSTLAHGTDAPWLFAALLPLLLGVVLAELSDGGMDAKAVALLGVLAAVGAALRPLGAGTAGLEPVFFLLVLGGRVLGRGFGFVLGALTLFGSALLTAGVGPWLPFQMLGAAWVGFFAGCLPPARGRRELVLLAGYGLLAGLLYGMLLDMAFWPFTTGLSTSISFVPGAPLGVNLGRFGAYYLATSLGWDLPRGVMNACLVAVTGRPVLLALRRATRRAAFDAPVEFTP
jgi:energy-coupling factor transport system substrate-specific component